MQYGKCPNFDLPCPKYVSKEDIAVPDGADFVCPECSRELIAAKPKGQLPWKKIAAGAVALLLISGGVYGVYAWTTSVEPVEPGDSPRAGGEEIVVVDAASEQRRGAVADFEPPEDWPEPKRELASHLVLAAGLPAGKVYEEETEQAVREREEALRAFEEQWDAAQREVASHSSTMLDNLPPPCTKDTAPLIKEITRKGTDECPKIRNKAERDACYLDVQRLNSDLGECETRNQVREEARRRALARVAALEQEQIAALKEELSAEAAQHNNRLALSE